MLLVHQAEALCFPAAPYSDALSSHAVPAARSDLPAFIKPAALFDKSGEMGTGVTQVPIAIE